MKLRYQTCCGFIIVWSKLCYGTPRLWLSKRLFPFILIYCYFTLIYYIIFYILKKKRINVSLYFNILNDIVNLLFVMLLILNSNKHWIGTWHMNDILIKHTVHNTIIQKSSFSEAVYSKLDSGHWGSMQSWS